MAKFSVNSTPQAEARVLQLLTTTTSMYNTSDGYKSNQYLKEKKLHRNLTQMRYKQCRDGTKTFNKARLVTSHSDAYEKTLLHRVRARVWNQVGRHSDLIPDPKPTQRSSLSCLNLTFWL